VVVTFGSFLLLPAQLHYHIEEKYLFSAEEGEAAIFLGILIPKSGPYQEVKNINISWDGVQEREDKRSVEVICHPAARQGKLGCSSRRFSAFASTRN
jgi:hypothetical protein